MGTKYTATVKILAEVEFEDIEYLSLIDQASDQAISGNFKDIEILDIYKPEVKE